MWRHIGNGVFSSLVLLFADSLSIEPLVIYINEIWIGTQNISGNVVCKIAVIDDIIFHKNKSIVLTWLFEYRFVNCISRISMLNLFFFNQNRDFVQISWVITIIFIKVTGIYANHIIRRDEVLFKSLDGNPLFSVTTGRCNKNIDLWYNLHEIFRRSLTGRI